MNKRIRKKLNKGEFAWLGFAVEGALRTGANVDAFLEAWMDEVERRDLECGGGASGNAFRGFVMRREASATEEDRAGLLAWLGARAEVEKVTAGPLVEEEDSAE